MNIVRKSIVLIIVLSLVVIAAVLWLKYAGVTHEDICEVVTDESAAIQRIVDDRYRMLDVKLDRIEGKLDRILEIAERSLPDGLHRAD